MSLLLLPQGEVNGPGFGQPVDLGDRQGEMLRLTLTINRISVGDHLDVAIWGSADGKDWGTRPIAILPHKYYCGSYRYHLDLTHQPDIRFLRVQYQILSDSPGAMRHLHPVAWITLEADVERPQLVAHA
ncbi:MAG: hypothetical protein NZV14_09790 [Bryobacteraceae bacterium]|nr:hypothetical protein [Bryobacteraceae bacterium]MDW8378442.1 hypothetical protein [Bryobacterales bacterium]